MWAVSHSYIRLNRGLQHETEKHARGGIQTSPRTTFEARQSATCRTFSNNWTASSNILFIEAEPPFEASMEAVGLA